MVLSKHIVDAKQQYVKDGLVETVQYSPDQSRLIQLSNTYLPDNGWTFDGVIRSQLTLQNYPRYIESGYADVLILNDGEQFGAGFWSSFKSDTLKFMISSRFYTTSANICEFGDGTLLNVTVQFDGSAFKGYSSGNLAVRLMQQSSAYDTVYNTIAKGVTSIALSRATTHVKYCDVLSLRCYNRALTSEEIKANYEIDKVRFGL